MSDPLVVLPLSVTVSALVIECAGGKSIENCVRTWPPCPLPPPPPPPQAVALATIVQPIRKRVERAIIWGASWIHDPEDLRRNGCPGGSWPEESRGAGARRPPAARRRGDTSRSGRARASLARFSGFSRRSRFPSDRRLPRVERIHRASRAPIRDRGINSMGHFVRSIHRPAFIGLILVATSCGGGSGSSAARHGTGTPTDPALNQGAYDEAAFEFTDPHPPEFQPLTKPVFVALRCDETAFLVGESGEGWVRDDAESAYDASRSLPPEANSDMVVIDATRGDLDGDGRPELVLLGSFT